MDFDFDLDDIDKPAEIIKGAVKDNYKRLRSKQKKVVKQFDEKKQKIEKQMATAPFQRGWDKVGYLLGSNFAIFFAYALGKFPNTHVYPIATLGIFTFMAHRYYTFIRDNFHMYLVDWCYLGAFLTFFLINYDSKNQELFIVCFLIANGGLAVAIAAFRNSLVYHRMDMLCSLVLHSMPMIMTNHIKWVTIPE